MHSLHNSYINYEKKTIKLQRILNMKSVQIHKTNFSLSTKQGNPELEETINNSEQ